MLLYEVEPPPVGNEESLAVLLTTRSLARSILVFLVGLAFIDPLAADSVFKAGFTFSPSAPRPGETVTFTDMSAGLPSSWAWDFGDGNQSSERGPTHPYQAAGT